MTENDGGINGRDAVPGSHNAGYGTPGPDGPRPQRSVPPRPQTSPAGSGYGTNPHGAAIQQFEASDGDRVRNGYSPGPQQPAVKTRSRFGAGTLVVGMLVAGLAGGGVAAGYGALTDPERPVAVATSDQESVVINDPNNVTPVTAAAQKAAPSVVTIAAMGQDAGGSGSGIILDKQGHILTNNHVATVGGNATDPKIDVRLSDGSVYPAELVGLDPLSDLAVLKIDAPDLVPADLGNSGDINVGDTAVAIGAPLGLSGTVTDGIVSTLDRTISVASSAVPEQQPDSSQGQGNNDGDWRFAPPDGSQEQQPQGQGSVLLNVIQTDAAINHGNSGGALVNSQGQIIGVNVAIAGDDANSGNIGVGFSIPINYAHRVAQELIEDGSATHGQLGVTVRPKPAQGVGDQTTFSVGAEVGEVTPDSPAATAGLKPNDVITAFAGDDIEDSRELTALVREQAAGSTVPLTFTRDGESQQVDVTVGDLAQP